MKYFFVMFMIIVLTCCTVVASLARGADAESGLRVTGSIRVAGTVE